MGNRDYGNNHKYLDPESKNYEGVIYQQNKPTSSSELVLGQQVRQSEEAENLRRDVPSGFLSGGFLKDGLEDYAFGTTSNQFRIVNKPVVHVNGWIMPLQYTNTTSNGENHIQIDAPPTNSGEIGVDFVFLEVWRALLKSDPSTTNKPAKDKVYPHGNIKAPQNTWLNDEMKDNPISTQTKNETSIRVQIQYRFRSVRLSDDADRIGYSDGNVSALNPDGSSPGNTQNYSQSSDDPGLWVAGTGDPTNSNNVDTVDGYMYSVPVCLVYRRNSDGFDFSSNGNGGLNAVGTNTPSDRPDGYYADQVVEEDIQDMRKAVDMQGWNFEELLEQNLSLLHDHSLKSWVGNSSHADWEIGNNHSRGSQYLKADDLIPEENDEPSGNTVRAPDGICRVFSDRSHVEEFFKSYSTNSDWAQGDQVSLNLSNNGIDVKKHQPSGTVLSDVISVRINDTDGSSNHVPEVPIQSVTGLGTDEIQLTLSTPPINSSEDLWVDWEITYPAGEGMTSHVTTTLSNYELTTHNPSQFNGSEFSTIWTDDNDPNTGRPAFRDQTTVNFEDGPHREVEFEYHPENQQSLTTYIFDNNKFLLTERAYKPQNNMDIVINNSTVTNDLDRVEGRTVYMQKSFTNGDTVEVDWIESKAIPTNGSKHTLYYRTAAIQAVPAQKLPNPLDLELLYMSDEIYSTGVGSGSQGEGFPWEHPSDHVPTPESADFLDSGELTMPPKMSIDDFGSNSGFLQLSSMIPVADVSEISLKTPVDTQPATTGNDEHVDYYKEISTSSGYVPSAFTQELSSMQSHRAYIPVLARLQSDTDFGRKGEVVMIVMSQFFDDQDPNARENRVVGNDSNTGIAVYKIKGNPVLRRR